MSSTEPSFQTLPAALQSAVLALLSPHQLARCACVSKEWRALVVQATWAQFYSQLWEPDAGAAAAAAAPVTAPAADWQRLYGQRQLLARCWLGRPASDKLTGHTGQAVKACRLLAPQGLLFTGGPGRRTAAACLQRAAACG